MPWICLGLACLFVAVIAFRNSRAPSFNGQDTLRRLVDRHREFTRFIAQERIRAKALTGAAGDAAAERIVDMERRRLELAEKVQRLQALLVQKGFGVGIFWLPTIEEFEKQIVAEQGKTVGTT